ncbi:MAG: dTMP kinase [Halobacteriales archaeon]
MLCTLEGLDGSGKTTVWRRLREVYPEATFTREPTRSWYGEAVRRSVADPAADPLAELFLYCADHADHVANVVSPALERDELVVSDRYVDSRLAYQGVTLDGRLDDPVGYVRAIHEPVTVVPDLTCYLRVDVDTALDRSDRDTKFERRDFLERVDAVYRSLVEAEPGRFRVVDATQDLEAVVADVTAAIEAALA